MTRRAGYARGGSRFHVWDESARRANVWADELAAAEGSGRQAARATSSTPPILIVPGYRGSGPGHWQSLLAHELATARRVEMPSWTEPRRDAWVAALERAVAACPRPPVLVAHSLGCVAVAHWAARSPRPVAAALLVAPCDVERPVLAGALRDFAPLPRTRLPFPSRIAASSDDPYLDLERAGDLAQAWGAPLAALGARGHINVASGFGPWPEGKALLEGLLREISCPA
jgi:hypothetical protein